jgi:hypothetical protein
MCVWSLHVDKTLLCVTLKIVSGLGIFLELCYYTKRFFQLYCAGLDILVIVGAWVAIPSLTRLLGEWTNGFVCGAITNLLVELI